MESSAALFLERTRFFCNFDRFNRVFVVTGGMKSSLKMELGMFDTKLVACTL